MSLRWLAIANVGLGVLLASLTFVFPPRSIGAACTSGLPCELTLLDRGSYALVPLLVFALFIGGALLLSRVSALGSRVLLSVPPLVGLTFVLGLGGAALVAGLQA